MISLVPEVEGENNLTAMKMDTGWGAAYSCPLHCVLLSQMTWLVLTSVLSAVWAGEVCLLDTCSPQAGREQLWTELDKNRVRRCRG